MQPKFWFPVFLTATLVLVSGCAAEPESPSMAETSPPPAPAATTESDPVSGVWRGDWGPNANDRNQVTLDLQWDGSALTGTINPGSTPIELTDTSYDPTTGEIAMAAEAQSFRGETLNYTIEGRVEGDAIVGTWEHQTRSGDFQVSRTE